MPLRKVTDAEITAANLRRMAKDLILEAERLEAGISDQVAERRGDTQRSTYECPMTGKKVKIKSGRMFD